MQRSSDIVAVHYTWHLVALYEKAGHHCPSFAGDSHQQAAAAEAAAAEHGRQQASHDKLSQQAVGDDPGTQPVPVRQTSINGSIAAGVAGLAEGHQHTTTPNGVAPSGMGGNRFQLC